MTTAAEPPTYPASGLLARGLDLLFPPTCVGCRRIGRWICQHCWPQVGWLPPSHCLICGRPWLADTCIACEGHDTSLDGLTAVASFDGLGRDAVHALKYHGRHAIARMMGALMARTVPPEPFTLVAPVSLHPKRRRERGYDQSAILARTISRGLDLPFEPDAVRRIRPTRQQATLDGQARRRNVAGAFAAPEWVAGERVLLVDDVTTTGATIEAAASSLRVAGADAVFGLVFAHAQIGSREDPDSLLPPP